MESRLGSTIESKIHRILRRKDGKFVPANLLAIVLIILFLISLLMIALLGLAYVSVLEKLASFNRQVHDRPGFDDKITIRALEIRDELINFRETLLNFTVVMGNDVTEQLQVVDGMHAELLAMKKAKSEMLKKFADDIMNYAIEQNQTLHKNPPVCLNGDVSELQKRERTLGEMMKRNYNKEIADLLVLEAEVIDRFIKIVMPKGSVFLVEDENTVNKTLWEPVKDYDNYYLQISKLDHKTDIDDNKKREIGQKIQDNIEISAIDGEMFASKGGTTKKYKFSKNFIDNDVRFSYNPGDTTNLYLVKRI